jgi:hypothetical protein
VPNVQVLSGGMTGQTMEEDGVTYYEWSFTVEVDGQVGTFSFWAYGANANNPDAYNEAAQTVLDYLESNPDEGLGGISQNDGTDSNTGDATTDSDDDDGALAGLDIGGDGDSA